MQITTKPRLRLAGIRLDPPSAAMVIRLTTGFGAGSEEKSLTPVLALIASPVMCPVIYSWMLIKYYAER